MVCALIGGGRGGGCRVQGGGAQGPQLKAEFSVTCHKMQWHVMTVGGGTEYVT